MPNTTPLFRQKAILEIVKRNPYVTFKEIESYVNQKLEAQHAIDDKTKAGFTIRTFQRDIKDIAQLFGTQIQHDKQIGGYFIESTIGDSALEQLVSAFDILNALKLSRNVAPYVFSENREPQGTEHIFGILHAIQNHTYLEFDYQKFWETDKTHRRAQPIAIKEYRSRWYLIANNGKDTTVKTFGLDRISNFQITSESFRPQNQINLAEKFQHYYGVIGSNDENPTEITLSFTPLQGKYIKSLPMHSSQKTILENEKETRINLQIYPTLDFIMDLLSYGAEVKVMEPEWLAEDIAERHRRALNRYDLT
jgi:predicted DNA-binding transcriptional regulator YafY